MGMVWPLRESCKILQKKTRFHGLVSQRTPRKNNRGLFAGTNPVGFSLCNFLCVLCASVVRFFFDLHLLRYHEWLAVFPREIRARFRVVSKGLCLRVHG